MIESIMAFAIGILGSVVFIASDASEKIKNILDAVLSIFILFSFAQVSVELGVICFITIVTVLMLSNRAEWNTRKLATKVSEKNRFGRFVSSVLGFGVFVFLVRFFGNDSVAINYLGMKNNEILTIILIMLALVVFLKRRSSWNK